MIKKIDKYEVRVHYHSYKQNKTLHK